MNEWLNKWGFFCSPQIFFKNDKNLSSSRCLLITGLIFEAKLRNISKDIRHVKVYLETVG